MIIFYTHKYKGFGLIEVIIASTALSTLALSVFGVLVLSKNAIKDRGVETTALFLAEEALEIARNIRDNDFTNLSSGTHGLGHFDGTWALSGSSDIVDGYTRTLLIEDRSNTVKDLTVTVSWQDRGQNKSLNLKSVLTDWERLASSGPEALSLVIDGSNASLSILETEVLGIVLQNNSSFDVVITEIIVSWDDDPVLLGGCTAHLLGACLSRVLIDGRIVWSWDSVGSPSGRQAPSARLDIEDVRIRGGQTISIDELQFDGSMEGETIDLTFIMQDGSQKTESDISP
jgi:competence protein ComGC